MTPEQTFLVAVAFAAAYLTVGVFATRHLERVYGATNLPAAVRFGGIIGWPVAVLMLATLDKR